MKKTRENYNGSEIHRLKPMKEYDPKVFDKMYKICEPVIKRLASQINSSKLGLTMDIIESQFWDKMLFVFNKYYGTCTEEHLKARILSSLSTYKNHLLQYAYNGKAEFNTATKSFEDLFDDSKEDQEYQMVLEIEPELSNSYLSRLVKEYMEEHLDSDALLVFEAIYTPPPYLREYEGYREGARITNKMLISFFELPKGKGSERYIREIREDIEYWLNKAREDIGSTI